MTKHFSWNNIVKSIKEGEGHILLEEKVAFVSGASREYGVGRAIALALASEGANVAV